MTFEVKITRLIENLLDIFKKVIFMKQIHPSPKKKVYKLMDLISMILTKNKSWVLDFRPNDIFFFFFFKGTKLHILLSKIEIVVILIAQVPTLSISSPNFVNVFNLIFPFTRITTSNGLLIKKKKS